MTAKYSDGSWNYPNGMTARYSDGSWNFPSGMSAENANAVLAAACEKVPDETCDEMLRTVRHSTGDQETAVIISFAWVVSQAE